MRAIFVVLVGSVLFTSGCVDCPEVPQSAYGTILRELPFLEEAEKPFRFPVDGDEHLDCEFDDQDFM